MELSISNIAWSAEHDEEMYEFLCENVVTGLEGEYYEKDDTGFFRLVANLSTDERSMLKSLFDKLNFSAISFTDSRSKFSFYNLAYLWSHIKLLIDNNVTLSHMASESVSAAEIYHAVHGKDFTNEVMLQPYDYTFFKTRHSELLGGQSGYIFGKQKSIDEIKEFITINNVFHAS